MRKLEKEYLIIQLLNFNIDEGPEGESLVEMSYYSLLNLLAAQLAKRE